MTYLLEALNVIVAYNKKNHPLAFQNAIEEAEKSLTEFSADRGVAAFKPLSPGLTN